MAKKTRVREENVEGRALNLKEKSKEGNAKTHRMVVGGPFEPFRAAIKKGCP
jgi:hypothetical protein